MANKVIASIVFYALLLLVFASAGALAVRGLVPRSATVAPTASAADTNGPFPPNTHAFAGNLGDQPTAPTPSAEAACIIAIDGRKYDVTTLRNTHSGGDVFSCGTDMSSVFHGQHGGNLRLIQPYLVR